MSLEGKTVLLFGAGAIASGYAPLFADEAENIVIVSRGESSDRLAEAVKARPACRANVIAVHADASDFVQVGRVYGETIDRFGKIDVVVNGSGGNNSVDNPRKVQERNPVVSGLDHFANLEPDVITQMFASNLYSKVHSMEHFARYLSHAQHQGSVVNIASMSGISPLSKVIFYSAANGALENFTRSAAALFGKSRVGRVNSVAVGFIVGDQNRKLVLNADGSYTPRGQEIIDNTALGRFLTPSDVAGHVPYLADASKSAAITGHTLRVDGGFGIIDLSATSGYNPLR